MKWLLVSAVAFSSVVSLGYARAAHAQSGQRIVVAPFTGPGSQRFRVQTVARLLRLGEIVIPIGRVNAVASSLGLAQLSDNYPGLASQLDATLFVEGTVTPRPRRRFAVAQIRLLDRSGVVVSRFSWRGSSVPAVLGQTQRMLQPRLRAMLTGPSGGGPLEAEAQMLTQAAATATADLEQAELEGQLPPPPTTIADAAPPPAALDPLPLPPPVAAVRAAPVPYEEPPDSETPPGLDEEESVDSTRGRPNHYDLSIGTHVFSRAFEYDDNRVGSQQNHRIGGVPTPNLTLEYYFLPYLGLVLGGEYSVPVNTRDAAGKPYKTTSFAYSAAARYRHFFDTIEVAVGAGFGANSFAIEKGDGGPDAPQVADVSYRQLKGGLTTRVPISDLLTLVGGGNYLYLLDVGELRSDSYFPYVTGQGLEAFIGLGFRFMSSFEARLTANLRRYGFSMNSVMTDPRDASGAVDRYLGINLAVAWRD